MPISPATAPESSIAETIILFTEMPLATAADSESPVALMREAEHRAGQHQRVDDPDDDGQDAQGVQRGGRAVKVITGSWPPSVIFGVLMLLPSSTASICGVSR